MCFENQKDSLCLKGKLLKILDINWNQDNRILVLTLLSAMWSWKGPDMVCTSEFWCVKIEDETYAEEIPVAILCDSKKQKIIF